MKQDVWIGDCIELMKNIQNDTIHLIVIDPPYEINYHNETWDIKLLNWKVLFTEFYRMLSPKGNLIIFQGWSNVCDTITFGKEKFYFKNWIIYDRIKGRGAKINVVSTREDILWFTKTSDYCFNLIPSNIKKKTSGFGIKNGKPNRALSNVWSDISPIVPWSKEKTGHPTQKPVQLMERIIKIWSNENDLVLDCFAGSGSTLVAAKNLHRQFIGIEKEKKYFDMCIKRIK